MNYINSQFNFLKTAISDPKVAAISRSSKYVVRSVLSYLRRPIRTIVEFGPGDGVMTRALLRRLPADGKLIAIESNPDFIKSLSRINDPRLSIIHGRVQDIVPNMDKYLSGKVDAVLSSVPFSQFSAEDRNKITSNAYNLLSREGIFIVFHQYTPLMLRALKKRFNKVNVSFELRNIFPCFIISGENEYS